MKVVQRLFVVYHIFHVIGVHQTFLSVVIAIDSIHRTGDELHPNVCTGGNGSTAAGGNCDSGFHFFHFLTCSPATNALQSMGQVNNFAY